MREYRATVSPIATDDGGYVPAKHSAAVCERVSHCRRALLVDIAVKICRRALPVDIGVKIRHGASLAGTPR